MLELQDFGRVRDPESLVPLPQGKRELNLNPPLKKLYSYSCTFSMTPLLPTKNHCYEVRDLVAL